MDAVDQLVSAIEEQNNVQPGATSLVLIGTELPEAVFCLADLSLADLSGHDATAIPRLVT